MKFILLTGILLLTYLGTVFALEPSPKELGKIGNKAGAEKQHPKNKGHAPKILHDTALVRIVNLPTTGLTTEENKKNTDAPTDKWWKIPDWYLLGANVILIIIFFFHLLAFRKQSGLLQTSVDDGRIKEERELRAYVHVRKSEIEGFGDINSFLFPTSGFGLEWKNAENLDQIRYVFKIRNHGRTPALNVRFFGTVIIDAFPVPNENVLISTKIMGHEIIDGMVSEKSFPPDDIEGATAKIPIIMKLTEEQKVGLRDRSLAFYIYGVISYNDIFDKSRVTKFRYHHVRNIDTTFFDRMVAISSNGNTTT